MVLVIVTLTYLTSVTVAVAIPLSSSELVMLAEADAVGSLGLAVTEADGMVEEESVAIADPEVLVESPPADGSDEETDAVALLDSTKLVVTEADGKVEEDSVAIADPEVLVESPSADASDEETDAVALLDSTTVVDADRLPDSMTVLVDEADSDEEISVVWVIGKMGRPV